MGARLRVSTRAASARRGQGWHSQPDRSRPFTLDVQTAKNGQFFDIRLNPDVDSEVSFLVLDVQPADRHLLLMAKWGKTKERYLCGHDERFWFAAAVPEKTPVSSVLQAKNALKPEPVRRSEAIGKVRGRDANRRRNHAFLRQGEWFFVPEPSKTVDAWLILHHEPLSRGLGRPHIAELAYREGGTTVYVCREYPSGVTEETYAALIGRDPKKRGLTWQTMRRDPLTYAKGRITHPDHKTIVLPCWHRVLPNTESQSRARRNLVFLD